MRKRYHWNYDKMHPIARTLFDIGYVVYWLLIWIASLGYIWGGIWIAYFIMKRI